MFNCAFRASLASWLLMNLLLVAVPRYGAYTKVLTGLLLVATNGGYYMLLPKRPLTIIIEGGHLEFRLGWCFWLVLVAGVLCLFVGLVISAIDLVWPHTFSTILEVSPSLAEFSYSLNVPIGTPLILLFAGVL